jgi:hypothetical protein
MAPAAKTEVADEPYRPEFKPTRYVIVCSDGFQEMLTLVEDE